MPFPSALSADGSTLVLATPATTGGGHDFVQAALLQTSDGQATSTFAFAFVPGTDTWAIDAALAPDGSAAYFGGTSATDAGFFALTGEAYVIEWIPRHGFTSYLVPDQGAPAMVTGLHIGPGGTHLYATGIATSPMGEGYLHATSFVR